MNRLKQEYNRNAIGVTPGDPVALAKAILDLIDSPDKRLAIGKAARQNVVERFNRDRLETELMPVYSVLLRESDSKADRA